MCLCKMAYRVCRDIKHNHAELGAFIASFIIVLLWTILTQIVWENDFKIKTKSFSEA